MHKEIVRCMDSIITGYENTVLLSLKQVAFFSHLAHFVEVSDNSLQLLM
jgi:hypothetical protein